MMEQHNLNLQPAPQRKLSPELECDLIMLKLLAHFGSVDKLRAELTERAKTDPGMAGFLDAFNSGMISVQSVHFRLEKKMPRLKNARREKFARELVNGKSARAAMICAGYSHGKNSSRMMSNEDVQNRIAELMAQYAERCAITKEKQTAKLQLAYDRAMELNQVPAAVAAVREQSILHGLRVERQEMAPAGGFEALNDSEYAKKIMERIQLAMSFAVARPPSDTE